MRLGIIGGPTPLSDWQAIMVEDIIRVIKPTMIVTTDMRGTESCIVERFPPVSLTLHPTDNPGARAMSKSSVCHPIRPDKVAIRDVVAGCDMLLAISHTQFPRSRAQYAVQVAESFHEEDYSTDPMVYFFQGDRMVPSVCASGLHQWATPQERIRCCRSGWELIVGESEEQVRSRGACDLIAQAGQVWHGWAPPK